ncbi:MmgE/PrpD family protein [Streptomyces sp. CNQ085]|uniref:MmgE/PrpD family protein n=1 Tax=Streptomyces sp. CNQ085 TaxID=2886944 RepID=UPI001F5144D0|nr:MmgE/PrpD family protein [Streptomyces sp. CNQ085]MCI0384364.1 MmgE/PrpD family protein [Streptomyces sp. CNQ085]
MTAVLGESVARALCDDWGSTAPRRPRRSTDTPLRELSQWAATLRPEHIPCRVLKLAASQVLSQAASIRAGLRHPLGRRLVAAFGHPVQRDPRTAAGVFAALGSWLNLDDTAYAGHLSNSTVAVPLAFAYSRRLDGLSLLTAVVAANECAARITASATLGPLRGQSAVHTHLAGAVAGRLHCDRAPAALFENALGLAFAMPNWPLMRAFLASDARLFNTFTPVRTAMDACDAAYAGLRGAPDIVEHEDGFLARFATVPLPQAVAKGLGRRWHTDTLSFKMHPGGPGIDAAVDCASEIHRELGGLRPEDVAEVVVEASLYTLFAGERAARYVNGPGSPLGALVLDVPYPVAATLLTGEFTVDDFSSPNLDDPARWELARRVRLEHDTEMTRELFLSDAPFGEAVREAGERAVPWLRGFGGEQLVDLLGPLNSEDRDFSRAAKATGARVTVRLTDGRTVSRTRLIPVGAAGPETRVRHADLVREKFLSVGGPHEVSDSVDRLHRMRPGALRRWIEAAFLD